MSGLYLIGIVALWLWLTWLLLRFEWRILVREKNKGSARAALVSIVILAWLGASVWYGGGRKYYYDWRVEQMCAVDGGVKVHEKVILPAGRFNQRGQINFFMPNKGENALGDEYIYKSTTTHLNGPLSRLTIMRFSHQIYRRSSNKLLGEQIRYARRGGDFPGPWHPSSFSCPELRDDILKKLFVKSEQKGDN